MISYAPDMTANYSAGTVATYTCDDGFGLGPGVGNSMRTCVPVEQMSDAAPMSEFDGAEPRCERKCSGKICFYQFCIIVMQAFKIIVFSP